MYLPIFKAVFLSQGIRKMTVDRDDGDGIFDYDSDSGSSIYSSGNESCSGESFSWGETCSSGDTSSSDDELPNNEGE